jgi:uncharacterized protein YciW
MEYVHALTIEPQTITRDSIQRLRDSGFSDGEILEVAQVTAYFNYASRVAHGLGIELALGDDDLAPDEDDDAVYWPRAEAS